MLLSLVKIAKNFRNCQKLFNPYNPRSLAAQGNALFTMQWSLASLFIIILLTGQSVFNHVSAQLNNQPFYWKVPVQPTDSGRLSLELRALGFSRNDEYFSTFADGYTLFGYELQPGLRWQVSKNVSVEAGVYARKDFGSSQYTTLQPTFQLQARFDSLRLVFGTIEGSLEHQLVEPMYDFERVMLDRLEEGVQVIYNKPNFWADVWIDWEKMIYPGDPVQEVISGGASLRLRLKSTEKSSLWMPIQFVAFHRGGQIDTSPGLLVTRTNGAFGLEYRKLTNGKFLHAWRIQPFWLAYRDASTVLEQAYRDGYGVYLNATAETKLGNFMLTYWHGNEFVPIKGAPLFSSYSLTFDNPGKTSDIRQLLMLRLLQNIPVGEKLSVVLRLEPFYDFGLGRADFSNSIFVTYKQSIGIKN